MSESNRNRLIGRLLTAGLLCVFATQGFAQEETAGQAEGEEQTEEQAEQASGPDTSGWRCRNCPFSYGFAGSVLFGTGVVSDESFEFGNFHGFEEDGVFGAFGIDLMYRGEDAHYLDIHGERLGLDSRSVLIEGGRQGLYRGWLEYDEIRLLRADDTQTIFLGAGSADQRLPVDWIRAGTTDEMALLDASLRGVDLKQDREILGLGFEIETDSPWRYRAGVERTTREGNLLRGGSFIFRAAELAAPVDYETTEVDVAVGFVKDRWELEAAYQLSVFDNRNRSVRFENAFFGINGADVGELAEPPDNEFHQIMLTGSWRQSRWLTLAGQFAFGRVEQDDNFLAPTLNAGIVAPALPISNLDGEVNTRNFNLRLTSNLTNRLRARAQFRYDERDNDSPRTSFAQIVSDTFLIGERTNEPFSHERYSFEGSLDYRLFSFINLSASAQHQETERTFQEVKDTDTQRYEFHVRATPFSRLNLNVDLSREERDNDLDPALLSPLENPDLRRFHFAEKERNALRATADYAILNNLFAGVFFEIADEDFADEAIGLSDTRAESYGIDLSATLGEHVSAHAFGALEELDGDIRGADNIDGAPWQARQEDRFRTAGFGVSFDKLPGKWVRAAIDFTYASADGEIRIIKDGALPEFPELQTRRFTLETSLERMLIENLNLRLGYLVGRFDEDDFFRDGVGPDTVPTLLSLGEGTPDETMHVVSLMLRYRFQ